MINPENIPTSTSQIFMQLSEMKFMANFTLVGGTALALQIGHRQSEDLYFCFDNETINSTSIKKFVAKTFQNYKLIREEKSYQLDFIINHVKLTFFSTGAVLIPFCVKDYSFRFRHLNIANINTIAALIMAAITQRCTIRDYYDLYFISKYFFSLTEIFQTTKRLFPNLAPITYSETIIFTRDIAEDSLHAHLFPKEIVTKEQISEYFISEIKKMREEKRNYPKS